MSPTPQPYFKSRISEGGREPRHIDASDLLANKFGLYIDIYSIIAKKSVAFKAFLEAYEDAFDAQTESHTFVGHPQPYRKQKSIERSITLSLALPASNVYQAKVNLASISSLAQMMHPLATKEVVADVDQYTVVAGGDPVFKVKFLNLISDSAMPNTELATAAGIAKDTGVRGFIDDLRYEFALDADGGGFLTNKDEKGFIYPKLIKLSFIFYPFESVSPLWVIGADGEVEFSRKSFPYAYKGITAAPGEALLESSNTGAPINVVDQVNRSRINVATQAKEA